MGPGFRVFVFGLQQIRSNEGFFFEDILDDVLLGLIGLISFAHCWGYSFLSAHVSLRNDFGLELELLEGRSCAALFVPKLTTWLAPAHVCSLACSWPWPARRCSASWAPLPVLQEALR